MTIQAIVRFGAYKQRVLSILEAGKQRVLSLLEAGKQRVLSIFHVGRNDKDYSGFEINRGGEGRSD